MKRSPLRRKSPLKAKTGLNRGGRIKPKRKSKAEREATESVRREVFKRDHYRCRDCGKPVRWDGEWWEKGHAAHIVSAARGGKFVPENLLTKCNKCHIWKEHQWGPTGTKPCPKKPSLSDLTSPGMTGTDSYTEQL